MRILKLFAKAEGLTAHANSIAVRFRSFVVGNLKGFIVS